MLTIIAQCDVKCNVTLPIKTITLVLKVSTYIITIVYHIDLLKAPVVWLFLQTRWLWLENGPDCDSGKRNISVVNENFLVEFKDRFYISKKLYDFCFVPKLRDIVSITGLTRMLTIIAQCDVKCNVTLPIKTITLVLKVSTYIITIVYHIDPWRYWTISYVAVLTNMAPII
jgi:hypothetical protein